MYISEMLRVKKCMDTIVHFLSTALLSRYSVGDNE
jgi:hypothetical protein